jgi:hypothetical protein
MPWTVHSQTASTAFMPQWRRFFYLIFFFGSRHQRIGCGVDLWPTSVLQDHSVFPDFDSAALV